VALELARAQCELGHEAWVAATAPESWRGSWRGVRLISLAEPRAIPPVRFASKTSNLRTHASLMMLCRREQFQIVHGHEAPYLRFVPARLRVSHLHNDPFWSEHDQQQWRYQAPEFRALQRCSDLRVCVSEFVARQLQAGMVRILGLPPGAEAIRKTRVVHNGVDLSRFPSVQCLKWRAELRVSWQVTGRETVFLYAGAIAPEKGLLQLAQAFAELSEHLAEVRLIVAGGASLWGSSFAAGHARPTSYEMQVRAVLRPADERGQVRWLGIVPAKEMPSVYAGADVLVIPSVQEACPLVALESMAAGRPLLAYAVGGIPELLDSRGGLLVPPGDVETLRLSMADMARDAGLRTRLGAEAETQARRWTWRRAAEKLERVYQE
jgi:glycosyltransferase involved in cell wall biosynthesis